MEMLQGVWKQHLRPREAVGYGVKIFLPSPPNYVTRSPGNYASAKIFNELIHVFRLFAILGYNICFPKDPCGLNNCRKDVLLGHLWCICKVGVDKYGNCVGEFILIRAVFK